MVVHAIPKPTPADRPKRQMDTTGLKFAKRHPVRDLKYRNFVRKHSCALFSSLECKGQVVCAHLTPPGQASRSQKYTDIACVGLCDRHHDEIDRRVYLTEAQRNELLVICWSKALELRESWWKKRFDEEVVASD